MGTLHSAFDCSGMIVNEITLGEPTFTDEITQGAEPLFAWDDPRLPYGVIENDGTITISEMEEI